MSIIFCGYGSSIVSLGRYTIEGAHHHREGKIQLLATLRPYTTTGMALVGASVIALTPIAPSPATLSAPASSTIVSTADVTLAAVVDPLTRWGQVINNTTSNLGELGEYWMDDPFPIASELITNVQTYARMIATALPATATNLRNWANTQMGPAIQKAIGELLAGKPEQATRTITGPLGFVAFQLLPMMDLLRIPNLMIDHIYSVAKDIVSVAVLGNFVSLPLGYLNMAINAVGTSAQIALDAFKSGDIAGGLSAIVNAPADLINNVLNSNGGLFDFRRAGSTGSLIIGGAILNLLIKLPRKIAGGIAIPVPAAQAATAAAELPAGTGPIVDPDPAPSLPAPTHSTPATDETIAVGNETQPPGQTPVAADVETVSSTNGSDEADVAGGAEVTTDSTGIDELGDTENSDGIEDSESTGEAGSEDSDSSASPDDATDFSDGDREESEDTGSGNTPGNGSNTSSGSADDDDSDRPTAGNTGAGTGTNSSGNDAGGSSDGPNGGTDS